MPTTSPPKDACEEKRKRIDGGGDNNKHQHRAPDTRRTSPPNVNSNLEAAADGFLTEKSRCHPLVTPRALYYSSGVSIMITNCFDDQEVASEVGNNLRKNLIRIATSMHSDCSDLCAWWTWQLMGHRSHVATHRQGLSVTAFKRTIVRQEAVLFLSKCMQIALTAIKATPELRRSGANVEVTSAPDAKGKVMSQRRNWLTFAENEAL